jgi:hypothetical protein
LLAELFQIPFVLPSVLDAGISTQVIRAQIDSERANLKLSQEDELTEVNIRLRRCA